MGSLGLILDYSRKERADPRYKAQKIPPQATFSTGISLSNVLAKSPAANAIASDTHGRLDKIGVAATRSAGKLQFLLAAGSILTLELAELLNESRSGLPTQIGAWRITDAGGQADRNTSQK